MAKVAIFLKDALRIDVFQVFLFFLKNFTLDYFDKIFINFKNSQFNFLNF